MIPNCSGRVRIARQPIIYAVADWPGQKLTHRSFKHDSNGKVVADNSFITSPVSLWSDARIRVLIY